MKTKITNKIKEKIKWLLNSKLQIKNIKETIILCKPYYIQAVLEKFITEKDFYIITSYLTPQSRSSLWQNYFIIKNNSKKIKASENKGDFCLNNKYYEYKISGFNQDNMMHLVQIRLWQQTNYIFQYISFAYNPPITFLLTHEQLTNELTALKATSAHGTKKANILNKNIELRTSIKINSKEWNRWKNKYKINSLLDF